MNETQLRMMELSYNGYSCSQILLTLALDAQGKQNPDLIRAMGGLANGCGTPSGPCGLLTGAACLLSLYGGKGTDDEREDDQLPHMLRDLTEWFDQTVGALYGGTTCEAIIGDRTEMRQRCGALTTEVWAKALELLHAAGYDITCGRD